MSAPETPDKMSPLIEDLLMVMGRPTLYKPEYCKKVIDHMAKGLSFESFAGTIDTNRDTLYQWTKVHPDFSDAHKTGVDKSLLHWEKIGMEGLWEDRERPKLSFPHFMLNMRNKHKWTNTDPVAQTQETTTAPQTVFHIPAKKEIEE